MAYSGEHMLDNHKSLSSNTQHPCKNHVTCICTPIAVGRKSHKQEDPWSLLTISLGQGSVRKTVSRKKKKKEDDGAGYSMLFFGLSARVHMCVCACTTHLQTLTIHTNRKYIILLK